MTFEDRLSQPSGQNHIFFLAKFFDKEKHATDFINGRLHANRLSFFKRLEEGEEINRGDQHEGTIIWGQPGKVNVQINGHDLSNDLAEPVSITSDRLDAFNVICMYAGYAENIRNSNSADITTLRNQLLIPRECDTLGSIAIAITNGPEFLKRVKRAAKLNGYREAHGLVRYYDPYTYSGSFTGITGAFRKQKKFSPQREYRIVLETEIIGDNHIRLDIGSIRDIAIRTTISEVNQNMKIAVHP